MSAASLNGTLKIVSHNMLFVLSRQSLPYSQVNIWEILKRLPFRSELGMGDQQWPISTDAHMAQKKAFIGSLSGTVCEGNCLKSVPQNALKDLIKKPQPSQRHHPE